MGEGVTYRVNHTVTDASYTEDGKGVISGTYALKFYDAFGEDYTTMPIPHDANCYTVEDALDGLPNTVIPDDSVVCHNRDGRGLVGQGYSLAFRGNPGYLKQLFVDTYLDGDRPTVTGGIYGDLAVNVEIFNEGMTGEFTDYFATQCQNVYGEVKANSVQSSPAAGDLWGAADLVSTFPAAPFRELNSGYYLYLDVVETKLLKQCLGDSDGFEDDNVEVYDWDYGSILSDDGINLMMGSYPHAIKLVQKDPYDDYQGGMYYLTWWESYNRKFVLANIPSANMIGEKFAVYVTDGVVERVIVDTELSIGYDYDKYYSHDYSYFTNMEDQEYEAGDNWKYGGIAEIGGRWTGVPDERVTAYFSKASNILYTSYDTACETAYFAVEPCLDKGDMLFIIDSYYMSKFYDPSQKAGVALTSEGVDLADLAADAPPLANSSRATCTPSRRSTRRTPRLKRGTERTATASSGQEHPVCWD